MLPLLLLAAPALALPAPAPWAPESYGSQSWSDAASNQANNGGGGVPASGVTHLVVVGGEAGLVYDPPTTIAAPGDRVVFEFRFKNHTVTQSAFDTPCSPLVDGFKSGFKPVAEDATEFPGFIVTVTDNKPLWFYCGQQLPQPHCSSGMVGAINAPPEGNTFEAFKAKAVALAGGGGGNTGGGGGGNTGGGGGGHGGGDLAASIGTRCPTAGVDQKIPTDQHNITTAPADNPVKFVTHGYGTQNYTCIDGKFAKNQAVATLYDTSCLVGQPVFDWLSPIGKELGREDPWARAESLKKEWADIDPKFVDITATIISDPKFHIGEHMFVPFPDAASTTANPKFDLSSGLNDPSQFIIANLTGSIASPDGAEENVRWVQFLSLDGHLSTNMYRLQTAGGQPPTSCSNEGEQTFIPYGARYDF